MERMGFRARVEFGFGAGDSTEPFPSEIWPLG